MVKVGRCGGVVVALALGLSPGVAGAGPEVEIGVFGGARWFAHDNQLGNSQFPDQVPTNAGLAGLRVAWIALPHLLQNASRTTKLQLAVEGEGSYVLGHVGSARDSGGLRPRYAASILGARGQLALRLAHYDAVPHLLVGAGTETFYSKSPYTEDDTDPVVYYGVGATVPAMAGFEFRFDVRHGFMPSRVHDHWHSIVEVQLGLQIELGGTYRHPKPSHVQAEPPDDVVVEDDEPPRPPPPPPVDPDPDHDQILADQDACPDEPEDRDGYQDTDGCPDPDNDGDGTPDIADRCPNEPEQYNGWQDEDGCPDAVPVAIVKAFELAATVKFEPGKARVTPAGKQILGTVMKALDAYPGLHLVLTGHPDTHGTDDTLASKRAEAVKWYLVDQGFAATNLDVATGGTARQAVTLGLFTIPIVIISNPGTG